MLFYLWMKADIFTLYRRHGYFLSREWVVAFTSLLSLEKHWVLPSWRNRWKSEDNRLGLEERWGKVVQSCTAIARRVFKLLWQLTLCSLNIFKLEYLSGCVWVRPFYLTLAHRGEIGFHHQWPLFLGRWYPYCTTPEGFWPLLHFSFMESVRICTDLWMVEILQNCIHCQVL